MNTALFPILVLLPLSLTIQTPLLSAQPPSVVQFARDIYETTELSGLEISLSLAPPLPSDSRATVFVRIVGGAAGPEDVRGAFDQPIALPASRDQASVYFASVDDGISEPDESVTLEISVGGGYIILGERNRTTVTLHNSPATFFIETMDGGGPIEGSAFTVVRLGDNRFNASLEAILEPTDFTDPATGWLIPSDSRVLAVTNKVEFQVGQKTATLPVPDNGWVGDWGLRVKLAVDIPGAVFWAPDTSWLVKDNEHSPHLDVTYDPQAPSPLILFECCETVISRSMVDAEFMTYLPLSGGNQLAVGSFTFVNGHPRLQLARLTREGDLLPGYDAPPGIIGRYLDLGTGSISPKVLVTRAGVVLALSTAGQLLRWTPDASFDETFKPPFTNGLTYFAEADDSTLWVTRTNEIIHLAPEGKLISSRPVQLDGAKIRGISSSGTALILREFEDQDTGELKNPLYFDSPTGRSHAPFATIPARDYRIDVQPDGSVIIFEEYGKLIRFDAAGRPTFTEQIVQFGDGPRPQNFISVFKDRLKVYKPTFSLIDHLWVAPGTYWFWLTNPPATALRISSDGLYEVEGNSLRVKFIRLGSTDLGAEIRFTLRGTATAGDDYVSPPDLLTFEPLEIEKSVEIPVLRDSLDELEETIELVVTEAKGIEVVPVPVQFILGGRPLPPRFDRIKKLRSGDTLLDGKRPSVSFSSDIFLEISEDLENWVQVTVSPGELGGGIFIGGTKLNGGFLFLDRSVSNKRFYRLSRPGLW